MVNSIYENIIKDVDRVRIWMEALRRGSKGIRISSDSIDVLPDDFDSAMSRILSPVPMNGPTSPRTASPKSDMAFFTAAEKQKEQDLVEEIIDAIFYDPAEREFIRNDPLVRMLISNEPGHYNFTLITAMGVITEGKKGMELQKAIERLEKERGVVTIRSDTGTARSFDYNAGKIEEAAELALQLNRPFGIVGYSQGCANEIHFESMMLSGELKVVPVLFVCRALLTLTTVTKITKEHLSSKRSSLLLIVEWCVVNYCFRQPMEVFMDQLVRPRCTNSSPCPRISLSTSKDILAVLSSRLHLRL